MAWRLVGIGWYVPLCLVAGAFIGYKLDERFNTGPWLAFTGVTIGLVVALLGIYIMMRPLLKEDDRKDKNRE